MDFFNRFKSFMRKDEERMNSIISVSIIAIAFVIIIIMWGVSFSTNEKSNINSYSDLSYEDFAINNYESELLELLNISNSNKLYEKTSIDYLTNNNLNEENFKNFMIKNNFIGNSIEFISSSCIKNENGIYVFRLYYKVYSEFKYVNIIEERPGKYSYSFEQESIPSSLGILTSGEDKNVEYDISIKEVNNNTLKLEIKIKNNNSEDIKIDFNDINTFCLVLNDNSKVSLSSVVSTEYKAISTESTINRELTFDITNFNLNDFKALEINNVKKGNESFNIYIEI